jgi:soluble lytic murein transglycosylase-like protein
MNDKSHLSRSARGATRLVVAFAVATVTTGSIYYRVQAQEGTPRYQPQQTAAARISPQTSDRWSKKGLAAVVKPDGSVLMTNNPEKYAHRRGYKVVDADDVRAPRRTVLATMPKASPAVASSGSTKHISAEIISHVRHYARVSGLDESLIFAVIHAESNFKVTARSSKGAEGLMQLMPATASMLGVRDTYHAGENIRGGTTYLARLLERFGGDLELALAGYNAGPEKVKEYGGIPPYDETRNFVRKVIQLRNDYSGGRVTYASNRRPEPQAAVASLPQGRASEYLVHFTSGHKQQAQDVLDDGDHYIIKYRGRSFRVKKTQIQSVTRGA